MAALFHFGFPYRDTLLFYIYFGMHAFILHLSYPQNLW